MFLIYTVYIYCDFFLSYATPLYNTDKSSSNTTRAFIYKEGALCLFLDSMINQVCKPRTRP